MAQKRSLLDMYYGSFTSPSADHINLMSKVALMDTAIDPVTPEGHVAKQLLEVVERDEITVNIPFLVPCHGPETGQWTWDLLGSASYVFFLVTLQFGDTLFAQKIGAHELISDETKLGAIEGWTLDDGPERFLVPRLGPPGSMSRLEQEIAQFIKQSKTDSTSGGGETTGHKGYYHVLDLTGGKHQVSAKAVGVERMALVAGLAREMEPSRFKEFCFDLIFDVAVFKAKCLEYRDRAMSLTDPNRSLALVRYVTNREVWINDSKFRAGVLGLFTRGNWTQISLLDFRRPGTKAWTREATVEGRLEIIEALMTWERFSQALKGEAFAGCMQPISSLLHQADDPLRQYHDIYIQYQLEGLLCSYYGEVCKHQGRKSKRNPFQPLVNQGDCVTLLRTLVQDFVDAALAPGTTPGAWETAPHHLTYSSDSLFTSIKKLNDDKHGSHGLCPWYLAGELGMTNAKGARYTCRALGVRHPPINTVQHALVMELVNDSAFMADFKKDTARDELRNRVSSNPNKFA